MSKIISYLDTQSDIQLTTNVSLFEEDSRATELFFLLRGKAELEIDGQSYEMKADDVVVVNKHERYQLETAEESLLFHFSISDFLLSQALEAAHVGFNCNSVIHAGRSFDSIRSIILEIIDLMLFENDKTNFLQMSKVYDLLNVLSSLFIEQSTYLVKRDERIQQITRAINERYYENISLSEMAELVHMDVAYFSKFFKKSIGANFKDYLSQVRMKHALRDLLKSEKTITRIAVDNGFFSTNGFNKKFKEDYQMTPSDFRKANKIEKQTSITASDTHVKDAYSKYKEAHARDMVSNQSCLRLDLSRQKAVPIKETWCRILNVGEAEMVRNSSLRQHLSILQQNMKFEYGRIWSVFTAKLFEESLMEYEMIDEILDSLLDLGLTPWLCLNKLTGAFKESNYTMKEWQETLRSFCRHILNRYGRQRVEEWKIEIVANDPEDAELVAKYKVFYQATCKIFKEMFANISIGGGSFLITMSFDLEDFLHKELADCDFDFYSFVLFPYSNRLVREKRNFQRITDPDFLASKLQAIKKIGFSQPLYISEWSNTVSRSNLLNDSLYKGAFIIKNLIDIFDQVDGLGYWLGTDLAQKGPKHHALLNGGNGLLSKNSLSKPAMHAMKFFDQLRGLKALYKDDRHLVASSEGEEFFVLGHHYVHPNSLYFLKDEAHLKLTEVEQFFEAEDSEEELIFSGISNGEYELRIFSCLKEHGDLFGLWQKFNFTRHLRSSDLMYLDKKNTHLQNLEVVNVSQYRLVLKKSLTANEFYVINIKKRQ